MKKYKQSINDTLLSIEYPIRFKKFKKLFKKIKKKERRFFIKLLKRICDEINNNEMIHFSLTSDLNLNQKGMILILDQRMVLIHSKKGSKQIYFNQIKFARIESIDIEQNDGETSDINSGVMYIKVKRKQVGVKNFVIRDLNSEQLPLIVEFIRYHK